MEIDVLVKNKQTQNTCLDKASVSFCLSSLSVYGDTSTALPHRVLSGQIHLTLWGAGQINTLTGWVKPCWNWWVYQCPSFWINVKIKIYNNSTSSWSQIAETVRGLCPKQSHMQGWSRSCHETHSVPLWSDNSLGGRGFIGLDCVREADEHTREARRKATESQGDSWTSPGTGRMALRGEKASIASFLSRVLAGRHCLLLSDSSCVEGNRALCTLYK